MCCCLETLILAVAPVVPGSKWHLQPFDHGRAPVGEPPALPRDVRRDGQCLDHLALDRREGARSRLDLNQPYINWTDGDDVEKAEARTGPRTDVAGGLEDAHRPTLSP